ncbi:peptidase M16 [Conservatibacter flavescens]|uniref:Peptidase M16 n=1 Tax=Conservatibacter flavescens TaxID=28161 RepID=A0A2M8S2T1_9PAST|nr:peptidase M16 [Conservatibacter flavescens]
MFLFFFILFSTTSYGEISAPVQGELANGLRYTILPLHNEPNRLEVRIRVNAGAVDEKDHQAGVAHMLEHLTFKATEKYPQGIMTYLHEHHWVRGRNYNAVTTSDNTTYMFTPPQGAGLAQTLDVLSQMLLHATLKQSDLDQERQIILEEWRGNQGVAATMNEQRTASVRANSRYTRSPVIGTQHSINTMPATELQDFYHIWYVPNNMHILIVGDITIEQATQQIQHYFGPAKQKTLPNRDYLDPTLTNTLRINKVQDTRSGVSQVAYIWRFNEAGSRNNSEQARRERLINRLTLAMLTQRLRNEQQSLPDGINSLVVRKTELGNHTGILGIFSSVDSQSHAQGLQQIFQEIERLKRYPFTQAELDKQKQPLFAQIEKAKQHQNDRDFSGWMQAMVSTVLMDKPYLTQSELANLTEPLLKSITLEETQQRLNQWFSAEDRIVQYQPPRDTQITSITQSAVKNWQIFAQNQPLNPPTAEVTLAPVTFEPITEVGDIIHEQHYPEQNVTHWQLSNGDKVVWLHLPLSNDRTYFEAQSSAGYKAQGLSNWLSQLATQTINQTAPLSWETAQLNGWKKDKKVNLSIKQSATQLRIEGNTTNDHVADLLRLYYATIRETQVKDDLEQLKQSLTRQLNLRRENNLEYTRMQTLEQFRYGAQSQDNLPTQNELENLTEQDLNETWQKMTSAPTTYFIANNLNSKEMKSLVKQYLATIPRQQAFSSQGILPLAGKGVQTFAFHPEPKDDVKIWIFTPHLWQGKDAVLVSLLSHIANQKLKLALRDEKQGIYSLRFSSTLNPETHRIESELSFTANPATREILVKEAMQVLAHLADHITEQDIEQAKNAFIRQEKERIKSPETWFRRLILSEQQYQDPRYLGEMQHLADHITLDAIKSTAEKLYSDNVKVFVTTQKTK